MISAQREMSAASRELAMADPPQQEQWCVNGKSARTNCVQLSYWKRDIIWLVPFTLPSLFPPRCDGGPLAAYILFPYASMHSLRH